MPCDLSPYRGSDLRPGDTRRASRAISRAQTTAAVRMAGVDSETDVALAKVDSLTTTTG